MVELRRAKNRVRISATIWMMTLEFARLCGWVPQSTRRKNHGDVDGVLDAKNLIPWHADYISNDGQTVLAPDGNLLADALDRAAKEGGSIVAEWQHGRLQPPVVMRTPPGGFEWFGTPAGRQHLLDTASFCRGGEFVIC